MDITSLPKTYKINGYTYNLRVNFDTPGVVVNYSRFGIDAFDLDYSESLEEAIDNLCKKIGLLPEPITEKWLEENGYRLDTTSMFSSWYSEDRRIELSRYSNMVNRNWYVHVDNSDFQTIGALSVQEVWQLKAFLELLGIKR